MLKKIWLIAFTGLLIAIGISLYKSPFLHWQGAFSEFARQRAISGGVIGILGTIFLLLSGWLLLKAKSHTQNSKDEMKGNKN